MEEISGVWARLFPAARPFLRPMPRAGGWYPVVRDLGERMVLEIAGKRVAVPNTLLEIRDTRPSRFSVVRRSADEARALAGQPDDPGRVYTVCPSCHVRAPLFGEPVMRVCASCGHRGEIAWWETG